MQYELTQIEIPKGATHFNDGYMIISFYKKEQYQHLNQVSEEYQTNTDWSWWNGKNWVKESGLRTDKMKPISELWS